MKTWSSPHNRSFGRPRAGAGRHVCQTGAGAGRAGRMLRGSRTGPMPCRTLNKWRYRNWPPATPRRISPARAARTIAGIAGQVPAGPDYDPLRADVSRFLQAVAGAGIEDDLANAANALDEPDPMTAKPWRNAGGGNGQACRRCNGFPGQAQQCLTGAVSTKTVQTRRGKFPAANPGRPGRRAPARADATVTDCSMRMSRFTGQMSNSPGEQRAAGRRRPERGLAGPTACGEAPEAGLSPAEMPGRVRLQPDAKFPLRYRELVGEYFRRDGGIGKEGEK